MQLWGSSESEIGQTDYSNIQLALIGAFQGLICLARSYPLEEWDFFFLEKVTCLHVSGRQEEPLWV